MRKRQGGVYVCVCVCVCVCVYNYTLNLVMVVKSNSKRFKWMISTGGRCCKAVRRKASTLVPHSLCVCWGGGGGGVSETGG